MKKNSLIAIAAFVLLLAGLGFVSAQTTSPAVLAAELQAVESTTPVPAADAPVIGNFYSAKNPGLPPLPGNIFQLPVWNLGGGFYLLDDAGGSRFSRMNGMQAMDEIPPIPGDGGTNSLPPFTNTFSFDTNGLYLQISNVADGMVYANLVHGTDFVYEIWSRQNLTASWDIADEVFPTDTNAMPFTVAQLQRTNLFLWARDWTGITSGGNTTPEWWFWLYFQTVDLSDTNRDSQNANTLLYDWQNGLDPNIISFSIEVTNNYVNSMSAPVQVSVTAGGPSYFAILVDDTNYAADAVWNAYTSSNIAVNLGLMAGWHDIWIGLKGPASNATITWQWKHLNLTMPPVLVITNPVTDVVDEPMIQIYGYCQESLAAISYDISNAVGVFTDQPSEITDRYYDTNVFDFTTNYFECLDVPLTNGLNTITIHATDLAGNTIETNFNFTLDYSGKTNPPMVQATWPTNGTQISGSSFTCRGWISDPTATVTTQLVQTNGGVVSTNIYQAEVERNGNFWLENLPITARTNGFAITVTDAIGNTSVTNISVIHSLLTLTVNPISDTSQLWQSAVNLTGTISDPTYAVWVNGVKGHNNGDGTWSVNNVPVNSGGTASFVATAYAPDEQQPDGSYGN